MTRPLPLLAALCAVVLLAAGCTKDKPDPNYSSVTPTASTTDSPTESTPAPNTTANVPSGAVSPTRPASVDMRTSDGAFAFVAYYWRMVDWAYSTNDGDVLVDLYQSTCASCALFRSSINQSAELGYTLIGGHIVISKVTLAQTDDISNAEFELDVALSVAKLDSRESGGAVATSYPPSNPTYRMYLSWVSGKWQVIETATVTTK